MAIEISGLPNAQPHNAAENAQVKVTRGEPTVAQQQTGRPSLTDTVSLTDTAALLRSLENTLAKLPVVDPQRVETFRQAIAEGSYKPNPERIAEKLLRMERELGDRK